MASRSLEKAKRILDNCNRFNIRIMTLNDIIYPKMASAIQDMPVMLYYKGVSCENTIGVGIVGARRCTQIGKQESAEIAKECAIKGIPVISGMAKGIDSYAHTSCILNSGYTVAVLGNGLDLCYPKEHQKLMEYISKQGMLISEYPPGTPPSAYHFPMRNRIISAWSKELYVIEAGKKSGAWITADYAEKYERKVELVRSIRDKEEKLEENIK